MKQNPATVNAATSGASRPQTRPDARGRSSDRVLPNGTPRPIAALEPVRYYAALSAFGIASASWSLIAYPLRILLPRRLGVVLGRCAIARGFRALLALMHALGVLRCDLSELEALKEEPNLLIVANHPSILDAVLLISRLPKAACIMKGALSRSRFLGGGARLAGYIRNDRPITLMRGAIDCMRAGGQLLIFPEGTRTTAPLLDPFTAGFAVMARGAQAPIQTVIIEAANVPPKSRWSILRKPSLPLCYRVRLGRRFEAGRDVYRTAAEIESYFRDQLAAPDPALGP